MVREDRALVERIARQLNATVAWRHAAAETLYAELERRNIDLVAGGVPGKTPWSHHIGLTKPVGSFAAPDMGERRLAVPPGENRWLLTLNRLIARFQQDKAS
jgi:polar amino acid transport system substrate-binding protein